MPKCTINGQEVEVKVGATIIEAFALLKTDIAHYCWHPGLSIAGVCRMCMVAIEGMPKLQIACNTEVRDGMVITNQSDQVKEAVKWTLDFHLINHPLDCPICDQAGECGLQNQYMKFGKYDPEMSENKVKKRKVVDLGPDVVLDTERCILCSRCVRFTTEVSKTNELGIFNRGDRSEIGTFENKPLNNKYSVNTVDICPVGALTSKEFRFQQRVWFLKDHETVCTGCSTGCNIKISYNKVAVFRARPIHNDDVNGHWMCDEGRRISHLNRENRLIRAEKVIGGKKQYMKAGACAKDAAQNIKERIESDGKDSVALVLTAQYTVEELEKIVSRFKGLGIERILWWKNNSDRFDEFDGLLLRGDRNPNTNGLIEVFEKESLSTEAKDISSQLTGIKTVVVAGPENQRYFPELDEIVKACGEIDDVIWLSSSQVVGLSAKTVSYQIPMKTFVEKSGTLVNHAGVRQSISAGPVLVSDALMLDQAADLLCGGEIEMDVVPAMRESGRIFNELEKLRGQI